MATVEFFNNDKGYEYVSRSTGDDVAAAHFDVAAGAGSETLENGHEVGIDVVPGPRDNEARTVRVI